MSNNKQTTAKILDKVLGNYCKEMKDEVISDLNTVSNEFKNVEWVFQFDDDEPIVLGKPIGDVKELIITFSNKTDSKISFFDAKGRSFRIFAREDKQFTEIKELLYNQ
jgi:hypothetical protein